MMNMVKTITILFTAFVLMAAVVPSPSSAAVTAVYVPGADCLNPADPSWNLAPGTSNLLKHINYTQTSCGGGAGYEQMYLNVKAVHNGTSICFRYEWLDPTLNADVSDVNRYADGVALQIAYVTTNQGNTTIQMGNMNNPVNIMFWRADLPKPQNIIAGGIGTVQPSPDPLSQNIVHYQNWANGTWTVIMRRPLAAASDNQVGFVRGRTYSIVFANWEGSDFERDGHKTISNWDKLTIQ